MKRFRLKVNPHLSIDEKKLLAEFVDILHTEDYYVIKENEELDKEIDFSKIKLIKKAAWMLTVVTIALLIFDVLPEDSGYFATAPFIAAVGFKLYEWLVKRKRTQVKMKRTESQETTNNE